MAESAEGIGGRKWSLGRLDGERVGVYQGKHLLAELAAGELPEAARVEVVPAKVQSLIVTAPQLWDAANEFIKAFRAPHADPSQGVLEAAEKRLSDMVAKAVGKTDWKDVLQ